MIIIHSEAVARGCDKCRKVIPAGVKYYYDTATRLRYHTDCKPTLERIAVQDKRRPAQRVEISK